MGLECWVSKDPRGCPCARHSFAEEAPEPCVAFLQASPLAEAKIEGTRVQPHECAQARVSPMQCLHERACSRESARR
eukprot:5583909-Prymnesium_polylepis.1